MSSKLSHHPEMITPKVGASYASVSHHLQTIEPRNAATHAAHLSEMFHSWKGSDFSEGNRHDRDVWTSFLVLTDYLNSITLQSFDDKINDLEIPHEDE